MPRPLPEATFAAIDVGTNAARLEMARVRADGTLETLHSERDPVRPGEAVFSTGVMSKPVADRLLATLRRFGALCRRYHARVRAVATSAVREAKNGREVVKRARDEAGVNLEVISGKEEARLICLGVLQGRPRKSHSLVVDIGGGSTEVIHAAGEKPLELWSTALGSVRLTEVFDASRKITPKQLKLMRGFAREVIAEALPKGTSKLKGAPRIALGSSGSIRAVVSFAAEQAHATPAQITAAVDALVDMGHAGRRQRFEERRADIIVAGAVTLEAVVQHLGLKGITAVDSGLRDGLIRELVRRSGAEDQDHVASDAALALGQRFYFDERHANQVARIALALFDDLASIHKLPATARMYLEVAALLHDIGHAVSYTRHHKHTYYLIQNADLPGLADRERDIVARIARYHRRTAPEATHADMEGLTHAEVAMVRKLSTLLRIADALDRSHHQPLRGVRAVPNGSAVAVRLYSKEPIDLEIWDAEHEAAFFRRVFRKALQFKPVRARS